MTNPMTNIGNLWWEMHICHWIPDLSNDESNDKYWELMVRNPYLSLDLAYANLANLAYANLAYANLAYANLAYATREFCVR